MLAPSVVLAVAATCVAVVAAQGESHTQFTIDPSKMDDPSQLNQWCASERQNCPLVCGGAAFPNDCFPETITYTCDCKDGSKPNISDYANTFESLVCQEYTRQCVLDSGSDLVKQEKCLSIVCGNKDPAKNKKGGSDATATKTDSPTSTSSGAAESSSSGAAVALVHAGTNFGTPAFAAGALALFGFFL